jgi:hypothetical protein
MFDLNGSQTAWLIYADWLEDQDVPADHIREMANEQIVLGIEPDLECGSQTSKVGTHVTNRGRFEHSVGGMIAGYNFQFVGAIFTNFAKVGSLHSCGSKVGSFFA